MLCLPVLKTPGLTLHIPITLSPSAVTLCPPGAWVLRMISSPSGFLCQQILAEINKIDQKSNRMDQQN